MDQLRVHPFDVGEDKQLLNGGVIAHITLQGGVGILPLFGGLPKKGHIEQVGFGGIGDGGLGGGNRGRDQVRFDGVGVDAVIQLGKGPIQVPCERQAAVFVLFEPLELLDEVEFELDRYPSGEFKSDVFMGESSAVSPGSRNDPDGARFFNPLLRGQGETVQARLNSKPVEFDGFKNRVIEPFPNAEKFDCIAVSEPITNQIVNAL